MQDCVPQFFSHGMRGIELTPRNCSFPQALSGHFKRGRLASACFHRKMQDGQRPMSFCFLYAFESIMAAQSTTTLRNLPYGRVLPGKACLVQRWETRLQRFIGAHSARISIWAVSLAKVQIFSSKTTTHATGTHREHPRSPIDILPDIINPQYHISIRQFEPGKLCSSAKSLSHSKYGFRPDGVVPSGYREFTECFYFRIIQPPGHVWKLRGEMCFPVHPPSFA